MMSLLEMGSTVFCSLIIGTTLLISRVDSVPPWVFWLHLCLCEVLTSKGVKAGGYRGTDLPLVEAQKWGFHSVA